MTAPMMELTSGYRTSQDYVRAFREKFGPDARAIDRLLGYLNRGKTTRRWEVAGAPGQVELLMEYIATYGPEIAEKLAKERDAKIAAAPSEGKRWFHAKVFRDAFDVSKEEVIAFRTKLGLTQKEMGHLLGHNSVNGRSIRLWETQKGAPPYFATMMAYIDAHGLDLAKKVLAVRREPAVA